MSAMDWLRRSIRSLLRAPAYAMTAIGSIAVGLALATATFAFVSTIMTRKPWFPDADRVFTISQRFGDRRNQPTTAERVALTRAMPGVDVIAVSRYARDLGEVELNRLRFANVFEVSREFWTIYPARPIVGRMPTEGDIRDRRSVLVSEDLWMQEFPSAPPLADAKLRIGDRIFDIIGVLPRAVKTYGGVDVYQTMGAADSMPSPALNAFSGVSISVKLKPGVSGTQLQPELERYAATLTTLHPTGRAPSFRVQLISSIPRRSTIDSMEILLYVLGFGVLAIGCTNVAALTLARGLTRRRDYALRMALGASRASVGATVFAEVGVITAIGGALGLAFAYGLIGLLRSGTPTDLLYRGLSLPQIDGSVFAMSLFAMLVAVLFGGALPAWRATRISPSDPLKDGAGTTTGRGRNEFRILVIGELAVATVLLMMASLVTLSLKNIANYEFGFAARSIVSANVSIRSRSADGPKPAELRALRQRTLEVFASTPGVRSGALMGGGRRVDDKQIISDRSSAGEPILEATYAWSAGPGFFTALGIGIRQGRDFEEGDVAVGAAILSRRAANILFPRGDAIGRSIKLGGLNLPGSFSRVVGISEDFQLQPTDDPEGRDPPVFVVASDTAPRGWTILGLAAQSPNAVVVPVQNRLRDVVPPGWRVGSQSFVEQLESMYNLLGYFTKVFNVLGFAALALGAIGVFSVLSYVVRQREREFAVRVSLGATPTNLIRVVMRSAAEFALGGTAIGALLSFWASAGVSTFLFGVKNTDPVSLVLTESILVAVTLLAALAPALRASRANPLDIIRAV